MKYLFYLSICLFLVSCSNLPDESKGLEKLNAKQKGLDKEMYEYKDFKKLDAVKGNVYGVEFYEIKYSANKVAAQNLHEYKSSRETYKFEICADTSFFYNAKRDSIFLKRTWTSAVLGTENIDTVLITLRKEFKKGDLVETVIGKLVFEKSEKGWR